MIADTAQTGSKIVVEKSTVPVKAAESVSTILCTSNKKAVKYQVSCHQKCKVAVLHFTISCSSKSRLVLPLLVLPFWYLLTRVVPDKFQSSSKTVVCVCVCRQAETALCTVLA